MSTCQHHQHGNCIKDALAFAEAHCATNGLRFTDLRRKVFQLIWSNHKALTASDIMQVLGKDQPPLTYRALDFLKEQKLVHYIASLNAYVGCTHPQDNHVSQMLVCTQCRDVQEMASEDVSKSLTKTAQQAGFQSQQTFIEVLGTCKNCAA